MFIPRTVPSVWIQGTFVGGNDAVQGLHRKNKLVPMLADKTQDDHSSL
jgi:glutaredoxin-related protein